MQNTVNSHSFPAEATMVAPVSPRGHSFDTKRLLGYATALAGRCAR
jgi:hypothetical protein